MYSPTYNIIIKNTPINPIPASLPTPNVTDNNLTHTILKKWLSLIGNNTTHFSAHRNQPNILNHSQCGLIKKNQIYS